MTAPRKPVPRDDLPRLTGPPRPLRRLLLVLLLAALLGGISSPAAARAPMSTSSPTTTAETGVVELLRLGVKAQHREAWLQAEAASWGPWLKQQEGFLGRQLFWDPERQEGTLLIRWASLEQWKAIPMAEVGEVQERFERLARELTSSDTGSEAANPFPLLYAAELQPQPQLERQPGLQRDVPADG